MSSLDHYICPKCGHNFKILPKREAERILCGQCGTIMDVFLCTELVYGKCECPILEHRKQSKLKEGIGQLMEKGVSPSKITFQILKKYLGEDIIIDENEFNYLLKNL